jgi:hypothetical protein
MATSSLPPTHPPRRPPSRSSSAPGAASTPTRRSRAAIILGSFKSLILGIFLGVILTRSFQTIIISDSELRILSAASDLAHLPPSLATTNTNTSTKSTIADDNKATTTNQLEKLLTLVQQMATVTTASQTSMQQLRSAVLSSQNDQSSSVVQPADPADSSLNKHHTNNQNGATDDVPSPTRADAGDASTSTSTSTTTTNKKSNLVEFTKQERVVIATKIHSKVHWSALQQMMCLLTQAYNNRVNYDIIVFTTEAIPAHRIEEVQRIVAPANFTVVVDNPGLKALVEEMSPVNQADLFERCNVTSVDQMDWLKTTCREGKTLERIGYNWQAEFRALHIWTHEALQPYKYMLWMDSDGFCTKVWDRDPVTYMIQNDLAIFFDHFPQGGSRGRDFQERVEKAFGGQQLCRVKLIDGHLHPTIGDCNSASISQVQGFFHITNLDFYRSPPVLNWAKILIGDTRFSRRYDDQLGVTVPAAMLAANKSWEMEYHGINLDVFHNGRLDGKRFVFGDFKKGWWPNNGTQAFPEAVDKCSITDGQR